VAVKKYSIFNCKLAIVNHELKACIDLSAYITYLNFFTTSDLMCIPAKTAI